jgi:hypothetical protein
MDRKLAQREPRVVLGVIAYATMAVKCQLVAACEFAAVRATAPRNRHSAAPDEYAVIRSHFSYTRRARPAPS